MKHFFFWGTEIVCKQCAFQTFYYWQVNHECRYFRFGKGWVLRSIIHCDRPTWLKRATAPSFCVLNLIRSSVPENNTNNDCRLIVFILVFSRRHRRISSSGLSLITVHVIFGFILDLVCRWIISWVPISVFPICSAK